MLEIKLICSGFLFHLLIFVGKNTFIIRLYKIIQDINCALHAQSAWLNINAFQIIMDDKLGRNYSKVVLYGNGRDFIAFFYYMLGQ